VGLVKLDPPYRFNVQPLDRFGECWQLFLLFTFLLTAGIAVGII